MLVTPNSALELLGIRACQVSNSHTLSFIVTPAEHPRSTHVRDMAEDKRHLSFLKLSEEILNPEKESKGKRITRLT